MTLIPPLYPEVARLFLADFDAPDTPDMEDAVVAWIIEENGWGPAITGNNPWNLHSKGGLYGQTGTRNAGPGDTDVAVFDSLAHGVLACANDLKVWASNGLYGYGDVIAALKAGSPTGFLTALAKSDWSAGHYGYPKTNRLVSIYEGIAPKAEATPVATSTPTSAPSTPTALTPSAEPVAWAGLITTLILAGVQYATGQGLLSGMQGAQVAGQATVIANALVSLLPLLISLVARQAVTPNGTVASTVAAAVSAATAAPVSGPASPQTPLPSAPAQAPSTGGSTVDPLTVVSSTPLAAGTRGSIPAETRRWTTQGELLGTIGPAILAFSAEVVLSGPIHGTFWLTSTTPPVYVAKADVTAAMAAVAAAPLVAGTVLTQVPKPTFPVNPPGTVLPYIVSAFVANNPALDPTFAAGLAQALGQLGFSAQQLTQPGGLYAGLHMSAVIAGLVVTVQGLPVYESQSVADGTVLCDAGLGASPDMGVFVQGAFYAPPENGHVSTAVGEILTPSGAGCLTVITPGTTNVHVGDVGSNVLG